MNSLIAVRNGTTISTYVRCQPHQWQCQDKQEIRSDYFKSSNLREFAARKRLTLLNARKLLLAVKIDFVRDLYNQYRWYKSLKIVGKQNGMRPDTLAGLFKKNRLKILDRQPNYPKCMKKLKSVWQQTGTINSFARVLGVHWETALKIHTRNKLPARDIPPKPLGRPPDVRQKSDLVAQFET